MQNTLGISVIGILLLCGLVALLYLGRSTPEPAYKVIQDYQSIRIVHYGPRVLAKVSAVGQRADAIKQGFRVLADFIFGANTASVRMDMTAPVMQTGAHTQWEVAFVMPEAYQLTTLPRPLDKAITTFALPAGTYAVIRFSGKATDKQLSQHEQALKHFLQVHNLEATGPIWYAFYHPPWTPGFLRRNEIMVAIDWPAS
jgi:effector-binding domain-containing protein